METWVDFEPVFALPLADSDEIAALGKLQANSWPDARDLAFASFSRDGLSLDPAGRLLSRSGSLGYRCGLLEPPLRSAGRAYAEFALVALDPFAQVLLGVTDLEAAPAEGNSDACAHAGSAMYYCFNARAYPHGREWCGGAHGARRAAAGDRVGLLVDGGRLWVYVNGARLGQGPMAEGLPATVRFVVEMFREGAQVAIVPGAKPPPC